MRARLYLNAALWVFIFMLFIKAGNSFAALELVIEHDRSLTNSAINFTIYTKAQSGRAKKAKPDVEYIAGKIYYNQKSCCPYEVWITSFSAPPSSPLEARLGEAAVREPSTISMEWKGIEWSPSKSEAGKVIYDIKLLDGESFSEELIKVILYTALQSPETIKKSFLRWPEELPESYKIPICYSKEEAPPSRQPGTCSTKKQSTANGKSPLSSDDEDDVVCTGEAIHSKSLTCSVCNSLCRHMPGITILIVISDNPSSENTAHSSKQTRGGRKNRRRKQYDYDPDQMKEKLDKRAHKKTDSKIKVEEGCTSKKETEHCVYCDIGCIKGTGANKHRKQHCPYCPVSNKFDPNLEGPSILEDEMAAFKKVQTELNTVALRLQHNLATRMEDIKSSTQSIRERAALEKELNVAQSQVTELKENLRTQSDSFNIERKRFKTTEATLKKKNEDSTAEWEARLSERETATRREERKRRRRYKERLRAKKIRLSELRKAHNIVCKATGGAIDTYRESDLSSDSEDDASTVSVSPPGSPVRTISIEVDSPDSPSRNTAVLPTPSRTGLPRLNPLTPIPSDVNMAHMLPGSGSQVVMRQSKQEVLISAPPLPPPFASPAMPIRSWPTAASPFLFAPGQQTSEEYLRQQSLIDAAATLPVMLSGTIYNANNN